MKMCFNIVEIIKFSRGINEIAGELMEEKIKIVEISTKSDKI